MLSNMALQNSIQTRHDQIYKKSTEIISMIVAIIKLFVILPFGNKSDSHECLNNKATCRCFRALWVVRNILDMKRVILVL